MLSGQDWTPVVLKKTAKQLQKGGIKSNNEVIKETRTKSESSQQEYASRVKKLESDLDKTIEEVPVISLNILDPNQRKLLITARNDKKLTQIQLAKMINEQSTIINNLENGKVVNIVNILQKINKILGTRLKFNK